MSKDAAARFSPGPRFLAALFPICVLALAGAAPARAEYPERLIHAIVPFATGGTNDITARLISPYLSKALGQNVVVENRPGASGNIGLEATAKSAPDGYTILFVATGATQNPALYRNLRFDPINDILPVFPDVPTTAEAGLPTFKAGTSVAVYVTGKTPADIVQKLNTTINTIVVMPEVREQLNRLGANPAPKSVAEVNQWYRHEIQTWKDIVKRLHIPPVD